MGQFEIKSSLSRDLEPDTVKLTVECKFVSLNSKEDLKKDMFESIDDIKHKLDECEVSTAGVSYYSTTKQFGKKSFTGKASSNEAQVCDLTLQIVVRGINSEHLTDIMSVLNSVDYIVSISFVTLVEDLDKEISALKKDLGAKCRNEASDILSGLGAEITGIDKVLYNSGGSLMTVPTGAGNFSDGGFGSDDGFSSDVNFDSDDGFDGGFGGNTSARSFSTNIVNEILGQKVHISENITVLFNIK